MYAKSPVRPAVVGPKAVMMALAVVLLTFVVFTAVARADVPATAWVTDDSSKVIPIDLEAGVAGTAIATGSTPYAITVSPDGKRVYFTESGAGQVTVLNAKTYATVATVKVGATPRGIAITPDGKTAYVVNEGDRTVTPIDLTTNTAGTPIPVGNSPIAIAISPDGSLAYVANEAGSTVTPIDLTTNTAGTPIPVGSAPYGVVFNPNGKTAYTVNFSGNSVTPINVETGTPGTAIPVGSRPEWLAISPDGSLLYVANTSSKSITPIETATDTPGTAIALTVAIRGIAFNASGSIAYAANWTNDKVTPIATATGTVGTPITLTTTASAIAVADEAQVAGTATRPTALTATAGNQSVALSWTAPTEAGASAIDHYLVTVSHGTEEFTVPTTGTETSLDVEGLTNGQTYGFAVAAVNGSGVGRDSTGKALRVPTTATAPSAVKTVNGDSKVTLSWAAPTDNGGAAIESYQVVVVHNGEEGAPISTGSTATSYTVEGLTNGQTYTFKIAAVNVRGAGAAVSSEPATLERPPGPTTGLTDETADGQVRLSWAPPLDNGGLPVNGYMVTTIHGGTETQTYVRDVTHKIITGLTNGQTYQFTVSAVSQRFVGATAETLTVELPSTPTHAAWSVSAPFSALVPSNATTASIFPVDLLNDNVGEAFPIGAGHIVQTAMSPDGKTMWVGTESPAQAIAVNATTLKVERAISLGTTGSAAGLAVSPDGSTLAVDWNGQVKFFETATGTLIRTVQLEPNANYAYEIAFSADGSTLYTANGPSVVPVNVAAGTLEAPIPTGGVEVRFMQVSPNGATLVAVDNSTSKLTIIDTKTRTVERTVKVGLESWTVGISPDSTTAYVVSPKSPASLFAVNLATGERGNPIPLPNGSRPTAVTISADGKHAYVNDQRGGQVVDLETGHLEPYIGVQLSANGGQPARAQLTNLEYPGVSAAPTVTPTAEQLAGDLHDPANPTLPVQVAQYDAVPAELSVEAVASSEEAVAPVSGISVSGTGAIRAVKVTPGTTAPGTSIITLKVTGPDGQSGTATFEYGLTNASPDATSRWLTGAADASTAEDVGGGYMLVGDDESNTLRLYKRGVSGPPVKSWEYAPLLGTNNEIDIESSARVGNTIYWQGSMGNSKKGKIEAERSIGFATKISGEGANTELTWVGYYKDLRNDLIKWDEENGNRFGFAAGAAKNQIPKEVNGFNVEGLTFAPGSSTTAYIGFRAPLSPAVVGGKALIVPVTNYTELATFEGVDTDSEGHRTEQAKFGEPILLNLGGLSIREMKRNAANEYLILAGSYLAGGEYALFKWDGKPGAQPVRAATQLPASETTGEDPGAWESIVNMPEHLESGETLELLMDNGSTDFFNTGTEAKELAVPLEKSRADQFTLALPEGVKITEVDPTGSSSTAYGADWFELTNDGTEALGLNGWKMDDSSDSFGFAVALEGVTELAPGESALFLETSSALTVEEFKAAWFGTRVPSGLKFGTYHGSGVGLSSDGDQVNVFNASGVHVTGVSFGATTKGVTLDNSAGVGGSEATPPMISTPSKVGFDGAFIDGAGEVGSPGTTAGSAGYLATTTPTFPQQAANTIGAGQWVTLTNEGGGAAEITGVRIIEDNEESAGDFLVGADHCEGEAIAAGATCKVQVRFAPGRENATSNAHLVITSNALNSPSSVTLTGASGSLPEGPEGHEGPKGEDGHEGHEGPKGEDGHEGPKGEDGHEGPKGEDGHEGPKGEDGHEGPKGDKGDEGPVGPQGGQGPTGPQGEQGDSGANGEKGDTGATGAKGDAGGKGDTGATGATGPAGPAGPAGPRGAAGKNGVVSFTTTEANPQARRGGVAHLGLLLKNETAGPLSGAKLHATSLAGKGIVTAKVPTLSAEASRKLSLSLKVGKNLPLGRHKLKVELSVGGHTLTQTITVDIVR